MIQRVKGERYRPVVTVLKQKKGIPTAIKLSGYRYTLTNETHMRGSQEIRRIAR